jgi:hypothetical protein
VTHSLNLATFTFLFHRRTIIEGDGLTKSQIRENIIAWDAVIHSSAGVLSLIFGTLMFFDGFPWSVHAFSAMMLLSFVSALIISFLTSSWVQGHFLAMLPVVGIALGYRGYEWGFALAYILIWAAFLHFLWRAYESAARSSKASH